MADEAESKPKSGGALGKTLALVFTAVVAPILVAVGVKHLSPKDPAPAATPNALADTRGGDGKDQQPSPPKDPTVHLIGASHWDVYEAREGTKGGWTHPAKDHKGAADRVRFSSKEVHLLANPHVATEKGGNYTALVSTEAFENYRLVVEYKWGPPVAAARSTEPKDVKDTKATPAVPPKDTKTPASKGTATAPTKEPKGTAAVPPKEPKEPKTRLLTRKGSVIVHAQETSKTETWMPGLRCVLTEGDAGSVVLRGDAGKTSMKVPVVEKPIVVKGNPTVRYEYKPDAPPKVLTSAGINPKGWSGAVHRGGLAADAGDEDEDAKASDLERAGDWNTLECVCEGGKLAVLLNGKEVFAATDVTPRHGRIVLMAEGFEVMFRRIDVIPLPK